MQRLTFFLGLILVIGWTSGPGLMAQIDLDALAERARVQYPDVPRKVLAFYYPWYGNPSAQGGSGEWSHWNDVDENAKNIASSTNYPQLGPYDSHDPKLIAQHCEWAKQAGVDGFIVSWWGKGSFSDRAMGRILDACKDAGIDVTIYYEVVPGKKNAEAAAADILDVLDRYAQHPAWLCVGGKPVLFIYGRAVGQIGLEGWLSAVSQVNRRYPRQAVFIGDQISRPAARIFDGIHTYNTAGALRDKTLPEVQSWAKSQCLSAVETADVFGRISTITVIPGYDDTKIRTPGLRVDRMDGASYRCQWEEAIRADPHWVLITSWNEWHEGSEIEPSAEDGKQYLDLTAEFTVRFKSKAPRTRPAKHVKRDQIIRQQAAEVQRKFGHVKIGLLPDAQSAAPWWLLDMQLGPKPVSWEEVAGFQDSTVQELPLLVYAAGEHYRQTATGGGDVDEGLLRYLQGGGFLVVLPSGPMPFHYGDSEKTVNNSRKFGLPLSISGPDGGWEEPPEEVDLQFVQVGNRLPHVPPSFPFPQHGDRRWRPFVRSALAEGDVVVPLLELRDDQGKYYGDAVAYVEHKAGQPKNGKALYAWFGLLNSPYGEALLDDLFTFAAQRVGK